MTANETGQDLLVGVILDRSGSMESVRNDTIGAYNAFVEDLAGQKGQTLLTLTQFDSESIDMVLDAAPIRAVPRLTRETFVPRGMTPLLDAVGATLTKMQRFVESIEWRGKVLATVITDGQENASTEWTLAAVASRINHLETKGWAFSYLGASPTAYEDARGIGIHKGSTSRFVAEKASIDAVGKVMAAQSARFRAGKSSALNLILEEERQMMERKAKRNK